MCQLSVWLLLGQLSGVQRLAPPGAGYLRRPGRNGMVIHASSCNTSYSFMKLPLTVATCVEAGQTSQGLCQFGLVHKSPLVRLPVPEM